VPIYRLLQNGSFEPEHIQAMETAFEEMLRALKLVDRSDPLTEAVAMKIIELAQRGEHDPVRLQNQAIREMTGHPAPGQWAEGDAD